MEVVITHFTEKGIWLKFINVCNILDFLDKTWNSVVEYTYFWVLAYVYASGIQRLAPVGRAVRCSLNKNPWHLYKCN